MLPSHRPSLVALFALFALPLTLRGQAPGDSVPTDTLRFRSVEALEAEIAAEQARRGRADGGPRLDFALTAGVVIPQGRITARRYAFHTNLTSDFAAGAEASLVWPSGFGLRAAGRYATLDVETTAGRDGFALPGGLGGARYGLALLEGVYTHLVDGWDGTVAPFWSAGAGVRTLAFDPIARPDLADGVNAVFALGTGADVNLPDGWAVRFSMRGVRGPYDEGVSDRTLWHTDLLFGLGVRKRLF